MKGILRSTFGTLVVAAFLGLTPPIYAKGGHGGHRGPGGHGGYHVRHGGNISWMSARGGHKFSRSGPKFGRGKSVAYRNWSGRKWSGGKWGGGKWDWHRSSGWGIPYALNYGYYSYGYYPWYRYGFGYPFYRGWSPYWSWGIPYIYSYSSFYPYWYYPSYRYVYDDCSISKRRFF